MDFGFGEEQQEVSTLARKILEDLVTNDRLREVEASDEGFDRPLYAELARANLLGVSVGEAFGGSSLPLLTLCLLLREVGRTVAPVPLLPSLVLGALPLERFGSEEQKRRWLPGVVSGEVVLTAALEEEAGEPGGRPTTTARREGDGWRLDGAKICVPSADVAARILVPARIGESELGLFWLDPAGPGVRRVRQRVTNRQPHFRIELDGARVPAREQLGDPAMGARVAQWLLERATVAYCAVQLGVSERALEMTAEYTKGRIQFDRPTGSFQAVHMRAADAHIHLEAMRLTCWEAAWLLQEERHAGAAVEVAKYWAAEGGQFVGYAAQHLHGGIGIDVDYPLHRYYLWAKQIELTLGAAPLQLARIGARFAAEPAAA
jgi:alkylation response protein AidB-like acyl-CoA dehydrogenase